MKRTITIVADDEQHRAWCALCGIELDPDPTGPEGPYAMGYLIAHECGNDRNYETRVENGKKVETLFDALRTG